MSVSYFAAKTLGTISGCFQQRCLCYKGKKFNISVSSGGRRQLLCVDCEIEFDKKMVGDEWRHFLRFEPRTIDPLLGLPGGGSSAGEQVGGKKVLSGCWRRNTLRVWGRRRVVDVGSIVRT